MIDGSSMVSGGVEGVAAIKLTMPSKGRRHCLSTCVTLGHLIIFACTFVNSLRFAFSRFICILAGSLDMCNQDPVTLTHLSSS